MCESHGLYSPQYVLPSGYTVEELLHKDCSALVKADGLYNIMLEHSSMHDLYFVLCNTALLQKPQHWPFCEEH